jgi:hypothetical protein
MRRKQMSVSIEVVDIVETSDGGAAVVFELSEDARQALLSYALKDILLNRLQEVINDEKINDFETVDIEEYIANLEKG